MGKKLNREVIARRDPPHRGSVILTERLVHLPAEPRLSPELEERMRRRLAAKMEQLMVAALQPARPPAPTTHKPWRPTGPNRWLMTVTS